VTAVLPFRLRPASETQVEPWHTKTVSYRIHGLVRIEAGALVLEWSGAAEVVETKGTGTRVKEETLPVRTINVPVTRVARLALEGRWWRWRVVLRATDLAALAEVPGARHGALTLWIARRDRALATELITTLEIQQADAALAAAEEPPPPLPPDTS
jgi:hypothetical protein